MDVHATAVAAEHGLGHEGCVDSVLSGDLLNGNPIGLGIVSHAQGFVVAQVDFMLTGGDFMMAVFDVNPHILQRKDGIAPQFTPSIEGTQVKIAATIEDFRSTVGLEVKVFQLGTDIESIAFIGDLLQHALEHIAGVPLVGRSVRV